MTKWFYIKNKSWVKIYFEYKLFAVANVKLILHEKLKLIVDHINCLYPRFKNVQNSVQSF